MGGFGGFGGQSSMSFGGGLGGGVDSGVPEFSWADPNLGVPKQAFWISWLRFDCLRPIDMVVKAVRRLAGKQVMK